MAASDGKVTLSTKLDTSGIKAGSNSIKSAVSDTKTALKGLASAVATAFSVSALLNFSKQSGDAATQTAAIPAYPPQSRQPQRGITCFWI